MYYGLHFFSLAIMRFSGVRFFLIWVSRVSRPLFISASFFCEEPNWFRSFDFKIRTIENHRKRKTEDFKLKISSRISWRLQVTIKCQHRTNINKKRHVSGRKNMDRSNQKWPKNRKKKKISKNLIRIGTGKDYLFFDLTVAFHGELEMSIYKTHIL